MDNKRKSPTSPTDDPTGGSITSKKAELRFSDLTARIFSNPHRIKGVNDAIQ
jgi:hypothetical protein